MSSGLRLRRPVFFAAGLRCPVCLRRIALCPVFLSVFRLSSRLPSFFPSSVFLPVFRFSLAGPHFPLPVFLSARVSLCPCFSQPAAPQLCRFVLSRLYSVWFFFCLVFPFIVHRSPLVVRRSLRRSSFIARRLLSVAHCPSLAARCSSPVASPVPRRLYLYPVAAPRLFPLPFGPDHGFCIRGIPACVSAGAACRVVPQRVPSVGLSAKMRPPFVPWSPRRF